MCGSRGGDRGSGPPPPPRKITSYSRTLVARTRLSRTPGSLELVHRSRQFLYTFNDKIYHRLEQRWLELSNSKHGPYGDFSCKNAMMSSIGPTIGSMTSLRQIQDGGPHDFRSKMAAPTTPRWRPPRSQIQDGGPCDAFGYTSEGESTP